MAKHTTREKVDAYNSVLEPFTQLYKELKALGMKKPAETLSMGKVSFINRILADIKSFMIDEPEAKYLDLLEDDSLPQYSDAILVLSQYQGALNSYQEKYYVYSNATYRHEWSIR